jgi:hypothetical protein
MNNFIEIPASKNSLSNRKLILGVGSNDANYVVQPVIDGKQVSCPYYQVWISMIKRCYSNKFQSKNPTYLGCIVAKEWHKFSLFSKWMRSQDWKGKDLDKDIIIAGNKLYSPDSCLFVSHQINSLLIDSATIRGNFPQGVSFDKHSGKYKASCKISGKSKSLGRFMSATEAEVCYLTFKSSLIVSVSKNEECLKSPLLAQSLLSHAKIMTDRIASLNL